MIAIYLVIFFLLLSILAFNKMQLLLIINLLNRLFVWFSLILLLIHFFIQYFPMIHFIFQLFLCCLFIDHLASNLSVISFFLLLLLLPLIYLLISLVTIIFIIIIPYQNLYYVHFICFNIFVSIIWPCCVQIKLVTVHDLIIEKDW